MWSNMFYQIITSLISGILIAFIFFLLSDFLFKLPNLSGYWNFSAKTLKTAYIPYEEMILNYHALIWTEGKTIFGTGEKISETSQGFIAHSGEKRTQVTISGYITKKYLIRDRIVLHLKEEGEIRSSSTIHLLKTKRKKLMGKFISTAADSEGTVEWNKKVIDV